MARTLPTKTKTGDKRRTAVIIGAGPAGLTAALELLDRTDIVPIIYESDTIVGGISRTVNYRGNRIDIGGHRFFSRSDEVMEWWNKVLPVATTNEPVTMNLPTPDGPAPDPDKTDKVMLIRSRLSRIYHGHKFYNYPVTLEWSTIKNLGLWRMIRIGFSYIAARLHKLPENSLEDFYVNRFGRELYNTFFRDYTEKVWGVPCSEIAPSWGAQRVKGLSVGGTILHAVKAMFGHILPKRKATDLSQKGTEVSLIEYFLYPKFGPGEMWETVAEMVVAKGGQVHLGHAVTALKATAGRVTGVVVSDGNNQHEVAADYVFSSMPVKDLVARLEGVDVPPSVAEVAADLPYRDFVTVGLLLKRFGIPGENKTISDNWIYIQQPDVKMGRIQIFNNWSPYMVADPDTTWIGLEYFADEGDDLWTKSDADMAAFGVSEIVKMGLATAGDVIDSTVIHMPKAYPAYFGSYDRFDEVRAFVDGFENLFLIGRNGQHRYNNQDHSMLTAITAVSNIVAGRTDKDNIWQINAEQTYHEEKSGE